MSLLLGGAGLKLPAAAGGAMASDASALYWYDNDDATLNALSNGASVTAWADATGNGMNLAQLGSSSLPTWNTTENAVEFTGSEILSTSIVELTGTLIGEWDGGGDGAIFIVCKPGWAESGFVTYNLGAELPDNNSVNFGLNYGMTQDGVTTTYLGGSCRNISDAFGLGFTDPLTSLVNDKVLFEIHADQSNWYAFLDGTQQNTGSVTAANYDVGLNNQRISLGNLHSAGATNGDGWDGFIYEVFATGDASTGNLNSIRSELQTKHGI